MKELGEKKDNCQLFSDSKRAKNSAFHSSTKHSSINHFIELTVRGFLASVGANSH